MPDTIKPDTSAWSPTVTEVPGLGPQHDISAIQMHVISPLMQAATDRGMALPPCGVSRAVLQAAQVARDKTFARLKAALDSGGGWLGWLYPGEAQTDMRLIRELMDLQQRLDAYGEALARCEDIHEQSPQIVMGLFRSGTGPATERDPQAEQRHFADLLSAFMIDNQVSAVVHHREEMQGYFWRALSEAIAELPETIWKSASAASEYVRDQAFKATSALAETATRDTKDWLKDLGKYLVYGGAGLVAFAGVVLVFRTVADRRQVEAMAPRQFGPDRNPYAPHFNPSGARKDVEKLLRQAQRQGCVVWRGGKHYKVRCPDGPQFVVSSTPSSPHAVRAVRQDLARAGVVLNPGWNNPATWLMAGTVAAVGVMAVAYAVSPARVEKDSDQERANRHRLYFMMGGAPP